LSMVLSSPSLQSIHTTHIGRFCRKHDAILAKAQKQRVADEKRASEYAYVQLLANGVVGSRIVKQGNARLRKDAARK
jgi:hypothetical protein